VGPSHQGYRSLVAASGLLLAAIGPNAAQDIRLNVVSYKLENGLRVLALEDHAVPAIAYYTFFRAGSRDERPGRTGIAHLFEHLMFGGAKKYGPGVFDRMLESRGGFSNAFTSEDFTGYHESFPSDALDLVVDMEADRMASLVLSEEGLATEREVVKEERRLRLDDDVEGGMFELLNGTAYLAHPYQWPVGGWMADLDAITVPDCREFFTRYYAPNNATIVVVGDLKPDRAIALIGKAYGSLPAQEAPPRTVRNEPPQRGERRATLRRAAQLPAVALAWHVPPTDSIEVFPLDLLAIILGTGDSSRLARVLIHEKELATQVFVRNDWRADPSLFLVYAEARPGVTAAALEAAVLQEVDRLGREEVADAELRKAKNIRTTDQVRELKTNDGKALQIGLFEMYFGGHTRLFTALRTYEAVTKGDLRIVAMRHLAADNRTVIVLDPAAPAAETAP
jgi:predicted Zn-dependent peptidase